MLTLPNSWKNFSDLPEVQHELEKINSFLNFVNYESTDKIYPKKDQIFRALELVPPENVSVILLGQDPYYNVGQANGLAFSVNEGCKLPPTLKNIFKELSFEGFEICEKNKEPDGNLVSWAYQGVLLLNTSLTVADGKPGSHKNIWSKFTKLLVEWIDENCSDVIFILWGNHAKQICKNIKNSYKIESVHPSPLSCKKFFGSRPFTKCNDQLIKFGKLPIYWGLD